MLIQELLRQLCKVANTTQSDMSTRLRVNLRLYRIANYEKTTNSVDKLKIGIFSIHDRMVKLLEISDELICQSYYVAFSVIPKIQKRGITGRKLRLLPVVPQILTLNLVGYG